MKVYAARSVRIAASALFLLGSILFFVANFLPEEGR